MGVPEKLRFWGPNVTFCCELRLAAKKTPDIRLDWLSAVSVSAVIQSDPIRHYFT
jgi:hypothetical protein